MRAVDTVIACAVTAGQLDDVDVRAIDRRLAASTPDAEGLDAAIIGGLVVATALTLLFLPALYVAWFRIHEPGREKTTGEAPRPLHAGAAGE